MGGWLGRYFCFVLDHRTLNTTCSSHQTSFCHRLSTLFSSIYFNPVLLSTASISHNASNVFSNIMTGHSASYLSIPHHLSLYSLAKSMKWRVQFMKLLIKRFCTGFLLLCNFVDFILVLSLIMLTFYLLVTLCKYLKICYSRFIISNIEPTRSTQTEIG